MAERLIPSPCDTIVCVKIGKIERENMYEQARKYWLVDYNRVKKTNCVLAIKKSIVVAVYTSPIWYPTSCPTQIGRYEFEGSEDPISPYLGKSVSHLYNGSANPVKYI